MIPAKSTHPTKKSMIGVGSWTRGIAIQRMMLDHKIALSDDSNQLALVATQRVSENMVVEVHRTIREFSFEKAASHAGWLDIVCPETETASEVSDPVDMIRLGLEVVNDPPATISASIPELMIPRDKSVLK